MILKKIDYVFSQLVRLKNADSNGNCRCICCGKVDQWKQMDAAHYIDRRHMALRLSEKNVQPCCVECNRFLQGNLEAFKYGLIKKYGEGIIEELNEGKRQIAKFSQLEIDILTDDFKQQLKKLKQ